MSSNKRVLFLHVLNGRRAVKVKKTLKDRVSKLALRIRRNEIEAATEKGRKTANNVNTQFSFNEGAQLLTTDDVMDLKGIIDSYAADIPNIIKSGDDLGKAVEISSRTIAFFKEWNDGITKLNEHYLEGYGDIYSVDITMEKNSLLETLASLKKCKKVPRDLKPLLIDNVANAIEKCVEMTLAIAAVRRNAQR